jgi:uncharacterized protein (TIGR03067 family)
MALLIVVVIWVALAWAMHTPLARGIFRAVWPDDKRDIQGTWRAVMLEDRGTSKPVQDGTKRLILIFEGESIRAVVPDGSSAVFAGSFALDPTRKAIDLCLTKHTEQGEVDREVCPGIYELRSDRLVLCIALPGRSRPKDVNSTKDNFQSVMILERER